jgi:hypothetical protein
MIFPQPVLMLNDDLSIYPWMRRWAEKFPWQTQSLFLINSSWSHFVLPQSVYERVGAFDPGFVGIGFEDMDYTARLGVLKMKPTNILCAYISHHENQPEKTSFDELSPRIWGKYTSANQEYFFKKWRRSDSTKGVYIRQIDDYVINSFPLNAIRYSSHQQSRWLTIGRRMYPDRAQSVPVQQLN